ncbi:MAG: YgjV family protein [Eubacteriales bacterium]|nr:YgjV family protein [Eubacteriales bacterium]
MTKIIANGFGVISTICFIISFQIKSNRALYIVQTIANVFYCLQFLLIGAFGELFNMGLQIIRNLLLINYNKWSWLKWRGWAPVFCVPSIIYMLVTWTNPLDILPFLAYAVSTFAFFSNSAKFIRLSELFCVSPAWLVYDLIMGAYGGVLTEIVILGSVIVSIIRFGWKGLDSEDFVL